MEPLCDIIVDSIVRRGFQTRAVHTSAIPVGPRFTPFQDQGPLVERS